MSKNKFYGRLVDLKSDQLVYFERYLNTINVRVARGYDTATIAELLAAQED